MNQDRENQHHPLKGSVFLTQAAATLLQNKYEYEFSFFVVKGINNIIYHKNSEQSRNYTDLLDYVDEVEYLKKYYNERKNNGKEEIKDRMKLLKNFYSTAHLLTYEHPMMVIHDMKDIFLKRHQRKGKIIQQSQLQDSQGQNQKSSSLSLPIYEKQFTNKEKYIQDMDWSDIIIGKFEEEHSSAESTHSKDEIQYSDEEYCIFESEKAVRKKDFLSILGVRKFDYEVEFQSLDEIGQSSVSHLIMDFDDLDREHIIKQYDKLSNKENASHLNVNRLHIPTEKRYKSFLDIKKPLSDSMFVNGQDSGYSTPESKKGDNILMQSMMIGSRQQRFQERQIMKRSSLVQTGNKHFSFNEDYIITESDGEDSPMLGNIGKVKAGGVNLFSQYSRQFEKQQINQFIKHRECIEKQSKNIQRKGSLQILKEELKLIKEINLELFSSQNAQPPYKSSKNPTRKVQSQKQTSQHLSETTELTPKAIIKTNSFHVIEDKYGQAGGSRFGPQT